MKRNIKRFTVKLTSALFLAAAIMSVGTKVAKADEMDTQVVECVETECEMPAAPEVEGQGDIIDDQFAVAPEEAQPVEETVVETPVVEAQPVAEVEGQGDVIDDQFAVVEGQGDIIDDEFAVAPEEAQPVEETEVEGQGDVIDDEFAVVPEAEAAVEAVEVAEITTDDFICADAFASASLTAVGGRFGLEEIDSINKMPTFDFMHQTEDARKAEEERIKNLELPEADKSKETKRLEEIYKALSPVKEILHADDESVDKIIEEKMAGRDKAEIEYAKKIAKLTATTVDGKAVGTVCPCMGAVKDMVKVRLLLSKMQDSKTLELKKKYFNEIGEAANQGIIDMIPGAADAIKAYKALVATEEFAKETNNKAISNGISNALSAIPGYSLVRTIGEWLF